MGKKRSWVIILIVWVLALLLLLVSRMSGGFASWYARVIYPLFVNTVGRLTGIFPFSVVEFCLYGLLLFLMVCVVRGLVRLIRKFWSRRDCALAASRMLLGIFGGLFLGFMLFGGINYQRETISEAIGLTVAAYSKEELEQLCLAMVEAVNREAVEIQVDGDGRCELTGTGAVRETAVDAMEVLGGEYELLAGFYPEPKPIWISDILSYQQISGIYSPFSIEANYNRDIPAAELPLTLCHELSHLKGFMREDEANFIAWLACIGSDSPEFRYSGYLMGFIYAGNALSRMDADRYREIRDTLCDTAILDLVYSSWFWRQYDGPVAEVATQINDTYLKANSQSDGVQSYGRMVELMLAYRSQP